MEIIIEKTAQLTADFLPQAIELGELCIIGGFTMYALFSLVSYGIIQALRLFNIKE